MATGDSRGSICLTSINSPILKIPVRRKDLRDISYTSTVIAYFVSNFVAVATAVSRCRICITSFNSPTPKTPYYVQEFRHYILH